MPNPHTFTGDPEKEVEFNEINHAISEIKYYSEKHIHIDYLFCIYQTLSIEIC